MHDSNFLLWNLQDSRCYPATFLLCNLQDSSLLSCNLQDSYFVSCNVPDRNFLMYNLQDSSLLSCNLQDTSFLLSWLVMGYWSLTTKYPPPPTPKTGTPLSWKFLIPPVLEFFIPFSWRQKHKNTNLLKKLNFNVTINKWKIIDIKRM